jgi:molybdopterin converting factor small subunit
MSVEEPKTVTVTYYALFREQRGLTKESVQTASDTPASLYRELQALHGFTLDERLVRAAVNGRFADMSQGLNAGDEIVFIPPVAGG